MKKNILLISLYYPPVHSIASNRMAAITKYLDSDLFDIDVVTLLENDALPYENVRNVTVFRVRDTSFLHPFRFSRPTNILLHSLKVLWNVSLQNLLPEYRGWKSNALSVIHRLQKEKKYDIIFSSYSPAAAHEVALSAKKSSGAKWIADMRDEMSFNPFISPLHKKRLAALEQKIFDSCDMITSVSKPILDDFRKLAGTKAQTIRFVEIRNGYDFSLADTDCPPNEYFTISHVGSFYGQRNPANFLTALSRLQQFDSLPPVKVNFIGTSKPLIIPENLRSTVQTTSAVSHTKALEIMGESDALLLIHPTTGRKGVYTGKLFEYLGMRKPIIGLVDEEDVAAHLIQQANAGYIVDNSDIEGIQKVILEAYNEWKSTSVRSFDSDIILKHHRKEQIKRLEKAIMELVS